MFCVRHSVYRLYCMRMCACIGRCSYPTKPILFRPVRRRSFAEFTLPLPVLDWSIGINVSALHHSPLGYSGGCIFVIVDQPTVRSLTRSLADRVRERYLRSPARSDRSSSRIVSESTFLRANPETTDRPAHLTIAFFRSSARATKEWWEVRVIRCSNSTQSTLNKSTLNKSGHTIATLIGSLYFVNSRSYTNYIYFSYNSIIILTNILNIWIYLKYIFLSRRILTKSLLRPGFYLRVSKTILSSAILRIPFANVQHKDCCISDTRRYVECAEEKGGKGRPTALIKLQLTDDVNGNFAARL